MSDNVVDLTQRARAWRRQRGPGWELVHDEQKDTVRLTVSDGGSVEFPSAIAQDIERALFLVTGGTVG